MPGAARELVFCGGIGGARLSYVSGRAQPPVAAGLLVGPSWGARPHVLGPPRREHRRCGLGAGGTASSATAGRDEWGPPRPGNTVRTPWQGARSAKGFDAPAGIAWSPRPPTARPGGDGTERPSPSERRKSRASPHAGPHPRPASPRHKACPSIPEVSSLATASPDKATTASHGQQRCGLRTAGHSPGGRGRERGAARLRRRKGTTRQTSIRNSSKTA